MRNARKELLKNLKGIEPVCAQINSSVKICLKKGHTHAEWLTFLKLLDFEYNSGYGSQNLFGIVWLDNGAWLERGEYDGSEWWEYKEYPTIPAELLT